MERIAVFLSVIVGSIGVYLVYIAHFLSLLQKKDKTPPLTPIFTCLSFSKRGEKQSFKDLGEA
jgi:H+/Cl- antiporter ClcA